MTATAKQFVRSATPVALLGVGVMLLVGCFTVPATRQLQTNGKRVPEKIVGTDSGDRIVPGKTRLADALIALQEQTAGTRTYQAYMGPPSRTSNPQPLDWRISDDARCAAVSYQVRTGTEVWPLCFSAESVGQTRYLVLDLDERGTVTGTRTLQRLGTEEGLGIPQARVDAILNAIDADDRRQLIDAGLLPDEQTLRFQGEAYERFEAERRGRYGTSRPGQIEQLKSRLRDPTSTPAATTEAAR